MILKEVLKFREHTRYFFIASGHADALNPRDAGGKSGTSFNEVPEELKKLLDEVAQEEGFDERLKQEVWDDEHARNVSLYLCLRKYCGSLRGHHFQTLFALSLESECQERE